MRKLLTTTLAAAILAAFSFQALASDPPRRAPQFAHQQPTWDGFYAGLDGGYGWNKLSSPVAGDFDIDGFILGAHAGFNRQSGAFVFGMESDLYWHGGDASKTIGGVTVSPEIQYSGTLRGRLGIANGNTLFYGTAGVAVAKAEADIAFGGGSVTAKATHVGWVAGAGLETRVNDLWSWRGEYRYIDYRSAPYDVSFGPVGISTPASAKEHQLLFGISRKL